eukprot:m.381315 g.381315  ORF g.381315 m.381315 type:complete len:148 (+) comp56242_c0_seq23:56-499(+)
MNGETLDLMRTGRQCRNSTCESFPNTCVLSETYTCTPRVSQTCIQFNASTCPAECQVTDGRCHGVVPNPGGVCACQARNSSLEATRLTSYCSREMMNLENFLVDEWTGCYVSADCPCSLYSATTNRRWRNCAGAALILFFALLFVFG